MRKFVRKYKKAQADKVFSRQNFSTREDDKMRNTMNIYKRKDGRFEGRIPLGRDGNGNLKYKYLYSKNLAELKEKMLNAYTTSEKYSPIVCIKTLQELSLEWLNCAKLRVKESSYCCYEKIVTKHIIPYFKQIKYCELNTPKINAFIEYLLKSGKSNGKGGLSTKTVHDIIVAMRSIAKYAEHEHGLRNPMQNISVPKVEKNEVPVLNQTERIKLQNYLMNNLNNTNLGILLTMYSGMRIGEVCALTWNDIDLQSGIVHVSRTIQRIQDKSGNSKTKLVIGSPKSRTSERDIPLPEFLIGILKEKKCDRECFILSGTHKPIEPRTMQNRFKSVLKKCGIRSVNFHLLRHTYATVCIENGFDAKTVSELLGHTSVSITLNRYVHSSLEMKKKYVEKLNFAA